MVWKKIVHTGLSTNLAWNVCCSAQQWELCRNNAFAKQSYAGFLIRIPLPQLLPIFIAQIKLDGSRISMKSFEKRLTIQQLFCVYLFSNRFFSQMYRNIKHSLPMLGCGSNVKAQWIRIIWLYYQITELQASGYTEKYQKDNTSQKHIFFKKRKSNPSSRIQFLLTTDKPNTLI